MSVYVLVLFSIFIHTRRSILRCETTTRKPFHARPKGPYLSCSSMVFGSAPSSTRQQRQHLPFELDALVKRLGDRSYE